MAVTIKDLAARCGLSISTISKAFNNYADISEETRARVMNAAREIGYYPNATARTLKTNRSYNLGILFRDGQQTGLTHPFFAAVLEAIKNAAEDLGYDITFLNHSMKGGMTYLEHCHYRSIDGVCMVCGRFEMPEVQELMRSGIPFVTIDYQSPYCSCVMSENRADMAELTRYVIGMGHRKIAYIHGEAADVTTERIRGFIDAMAEAGLPVPDAYLRESVYSAPGITHRAVEELLDLDDRPTCIILPDDYSSFGAIPALQERGLRFPEDVSLAGYDGITMTQELHPSLTTMQQNIREIGAQAAGELIRQIERPGEPRDRVINIHGRLIPGESVAAVPAD